MADSFFHGLFSSIADSGRELLGLRDEQGGGVEAAVDYCHALLSSRGEAAGAAFALETLAAYDGLSADDRPDFFQRLVDDFSADTAKVLAAADAFRNDPSPGRLNDLADISEPPRRELLRRLNMAPDGTHALVRMREQVLQLMREWPDLAALDDDLNHLFISWFNRGFLELKRIDWRTPAVVLEKLIAYEAVHSIKGWDDLRRRLASDRRCFGFFHPALPDEPLIFVQVALVRGMSDAIGPLLETGSKVMDPLTADTAVFYSISNCQKGLTGISFGNFLIKQVAAELGQEFPNIKTFTTLSPIPGFSRWLQATVDKDPALGETLGDVGWSDDPASAESSPDDAFKEPLTQLAAFYLTRAKRGTLPLDPVARFHLGNGARLERINWHGDFSAKGLAQSHGLMVNYLYRLDLVEKNHEAFVNSQKVVASRAVETLAKASVLAKRESAPQSAEPATVG